MTDFGLKSLCFDVKTLSGHYSAPFRGWDFILRHNVTVFLTLTLLQVLSSPFLRTRNDTSVFTGISKFFSRSGWRIVSP